MNDHEIITEVERQLGQGSGFDYGDEPPGWEGERVAELLRHDLLPLLKRVLARLEALEKRSDE